jgi:uncharacterized protein (TIGR03086 family)
MSRLFKTAAARGCQARRMSADHVTSAAAVFTEIVRNVKPNQLADPTPCAEYDVAKLVNHLLFWGPSLVGAARKETVPPPAADESDVDLADDWAAALVAQARDIAAGWAAPGAWDGVTHMGGPMELPAELVGGMIAGELLIHGWDLARATGQRPEWSEELLAYAHGEVARSVELGRQLGIYGPEVATGAGASTLDRTLALSGRDPDWAA